MQNASSTREWIEEKKTERKGGGYYLQREKKARKD